MIRKLELKDAPRMWEWMHDMSVLKGLQSEKFLKMTLEDCESFIRSCADDSINLHRAIVDKSDRYVGTVSLKKIDPNYKDAEFAIVLRSDAQGYGYATQSMKEIFQYAFEVRGLNEVYLNVLKTNDKAIALYKRGGFVKMQKVSERCLNRAPRKIGGCIEEVYFYHITKEMYFE